MATKYKLSYTAQEIDKKLGKIDNLVATVNGVAPDENGNVEISVSGGNVDYALPVGGDELGGVKNGGNVVINTDGTMTAPESTVQTVELDTSLSVVGKAADAKAVGDALENVNSTNIYIGDNTYTTVDEEGNVTTVEGGGGGSVPESGGTASSAEWRHLATVDFADETNQISSTRFDGLENITEIFVKSNSVQSADNGVTSNFYLAINGVKVAMSILPITKSGTVQYAWFYANYNGLVWMPVRANSGAIEDNNVSAQAMWVPYNLILDVGAATNFSLTVSNDSYIPVTGTLEVYVR